MTLTLQTLSLILALIGLLLELEWIRRMRQGKATVKLLIVIVMFWQGAFVLQALSHLKITH